MLVCVRKGITGIAILKRAEEGVEEYMILHLLRLCLNRSGNAAQMLMPALPTLLLIMSC